MRIDVVLLPSMLDDSVLAGRAVVVFDVLRATTTMAAALSAGVKEIRVFDSVEAAREAAGAFDGPRLLCGESQCLPPAGFDLGNSPGAFCANQAGKVAFMSTTNGTRAILAAAGAPDVLIGALVNASATAGRLAQLGRDVMMLCAGTNGRPAMEDVLGAGAVLAALERLCEIALETDVARMAARLFGSIRHDLRAALAESDGGKNVMRAGLNEDIDFAARLDVLPIAGVVKNNPLRVERQAD